VRTLSTKDYLTPVPFTFPQSFSAISNVHEFYLHDDAVEKLVAFFKDKGLSRLKEEDRAETWYADWLAYAAQHKIYADLLTPKEYSTTGGEFDLLRLTRFLEVFGYFSPSHGYSLQVTFLGLFPILMGLNHALKREAITLLDRGELFAFAISERDHGSDLLGNTFNLREISPGQFIANGQKHYIGNANCAAIISTVARKESARTRGNVRRAPMVLMALRPSRKPLVNLQKIRTIGIRSAFVGAFEVRDFALKQDDIITEGRDAWDAIFGTVTLGKFFLGFGAIGICEHALDEALVHLRGRNLYGEPALNLPHIRWLMSQAYARLTAMRLYAYRALDYVQGSNENDRRYQLYCAVQKAKVGTEGVKVMSLLAECVGAKAFEADGYFEMALRDAPLIPALEGSTHINLALIAQFIRPYFTTADVTPKDPPSVSQGNRSRENPYLFVARTGGIKGISFPAVRSSYEPFMSLANVRLFVEQADAFARAMREADPKETSSDALIAVGLGQCLATIAYAQLVAENAVRLSVPAQVVNAMFHSLVLDLSAAATALASSPGNWILPSDCVAIPSFTAPDWDVLVDQMLSN
jgi:acyl-CoA dehydrogenase